ARLALAVRHRPGDARHRLALSPCGRALLRSLRTWPGALLRVAGRGTAAVATARKPGAAWDCRRRWLVGAALERRRLGRLRGVWADHRRGCRDGCLVRPDRLAAAARSRA